MNVDLLTYAVSHGLLLPHNALHEASSLLATLPALPLSNSKDIMQKLFSSIKPYKEQLTMTQSNKDALVKLVKQLQRKELPRFDLDHDLPSMPPLPSFSNELFSILKVIS